MVDDPETFGAIAAANSLSDVYAMGGVPEVALSFVGFPSDKLPLEVLHEIILGLTRTCKLARCAIVGGHTIVDPEPKAGLSVTGSVSSDRIWSHRFGAAGQALVLTKAIGTGLVVQALKKGTAPPDAVESAIAQMKRLNDRARDLGADAHATACTDVTGFGLLGHLKNLVEASKVRARLVASNVPLLPHVRAIAEGGTVPGGTKRNLRYVEPMTRFDASVDEITRLVLADAQTSGGLLLTVPDREAEALVRRLRDEGHAAAVIGSLENLPTDDPHAIVVDA
jgi:selenide,water dikinase